ncbi:hypothetical protein M3398_29170 [Streptomyces albidoflavus]|uniref:hypothetical protein n=1 Tax=Streptomyces TaxID=1883 RepID=UPI001436BDB5|nr:MULTISPECIES: hypothetical protein [Streptomyces]MBV7255017.1 hypothetical protein [Streptomyces sp. S-2]MCL6281342.1 hypothetical protein [Streptomyces albidoflavus]WTE00859.1 hypothetical protein OG950_30855 [Streptomyces albidoflavus]
MFAILKEPEVVAVLVGAPLVLITAWASYATGKQSGRAAMDAVRRQELETAVRDVAAVALEFHSYCSAALRPSLGGGLHPDRPQQWDVTDRYLATVGRIQNGTLAAGNLVHDAGGDLQKAANDLHKAVREALADDPPQAMLDAIDAAHAAYADARGVFLLAGRTELAVFPEYSLGTGRSLVIRWSARGSGGSHRTTGVTGATGRHVGEPTI